MGLLVSFCPVLRLALALLLLPAGYARVLPPLFSPLAVPNSAPLLPPAPQPNATAAPGPALSGMEIATDYHQHHLSKRSVLTATLVSFGVALILFSLLFLWIYRKKHGRRVESKGTSTTGSVQGHSLGTISMKFNSMKSNRGNVPNLEYALLESATGNFSESSIIGEGGFGCVYKARLEGGLVAIKKIDQGGQDYEKEFENEIDLLSRIRHSNIVSLLGCCTHGQKRFLVYEFMQNGSLEEQLHGPSHGTYLTWYIRMKIALDIARGLEYLHEHCSPPIIHRDMKSSNILLDANFTAKISDFGLAVCGGNQSKGTAKLSGTLGYVAPEYLLDGKLSEKSDVYAFGVVLLELLLGRKPVEKMAPSQCQSIVTWAMPQLTDRAKLPNIIDPAIQSTLDLKHLYQVAAVAVLCVQPEPSYRPLITDVLHSLIPLVPVELGGALKATDLSSHTNRTPSHPL